MSFLDFLPGIGSLVSGVSNVISGNANNKSNQEINQKNIDWQRESLDINKKNALEQWNRENAYNTPQAQMQRFKDADLNPNLIYGQGTPGNASSQSVPQRGTPDLKPNNYTQIGKAPGAALQAYQNVKLNQAQIENVNANTMVARSNAALNDTRAANIDADTTLKGSSTGLNQLSLRQGQSLFDTNIEQAKENLRKTSTGIDISLQENERAALSNAMELQKGNLSLKQGLESILNMRSQRANNAAERDRIRAQINNINHSTSLQQLEIDLKKRGMTWSDPLYLRAANQILSNADTGMPAIDNTVNDIKKGFNNFWDEATKPRDIGLPGYQDKMKKWKGQHKK